MKGIAVVVLVSVIPAASAIHAWLGIRKSSSLVRNYQERLRKHQFDSAGALHYSALTPAELKALTSGYRTGSNGYPSSAQVARLSRPEKTAYLARARLLQRLAPLAGPVAAVVVPVLLSQFGSGVYRLLEDHVSVQWAQGIAAIGVIYAILAIAAALALGVAVEARAERRAEVLDASLRSNRGGRPGP